jgi:hypothetical protein
MMKPQIRGQQLLRMQPEFSNEPLDSADRDAILEVEKSPGFALIQLRIHEEITRRSAELELPADIESTQYIRGALYALRTVLQIPKILKAEIQ